RGAGRARGGRVPRRSVSVTTRSAVISSPQARARGRSSSEPAPTACGPRPGPRTTRSARPLAGLLGTGRLALPGAGRGRSPSPFNRPHSLLELGQQGAGLGALRGGREHDVGPALLGGLHDVNQHVGPLPVEVGSLASVT